MCKSFGGLVAVNEVGFDVRAGEIVGLIGPNGAGKSTTLHAIMRLVPLTGGEILLRGSGLRGAGAVREMTAREADGMPLTLLRPLLEATRGDTEAVCAEWDVTPASDGTNRSLRYARNRIRRRVLPYLETINPAVRKALAAFADEAHLATAQALFASVGRTIVLDEKLMDAVTGLSASGPAFIYIILESLAEAGVKVGLPRDIATLLAAQPTFGAAKMVLETGYRPALLKDAVTTPAGCTIDGILELEEGGLRVTLERAR